MIAGGLRGIFMMLTTQGAPIRKNQRGDLYVPTLNPWQEVFNGEWSLVGWF